jgi:hypothetical protein
VAAAAGAGSLLGFGRIMLQQFIQQQRSRLVEGGADRHLHRLQVQVRGVVTLAKDESQQFFYFTGDFLLDGLRRFFSCGVSDSSTGRARQIFSLTSNKRCANWRKR